MRYSELRKGSLCDGLKKRYGLVHVSPGQLLREEVERETELGLKAPRARPLSGQNETRSLIIVYHQFITNFFMVLQL